MCIVPNCKNKTKYATGFYHLSSQKIQNMSKFLNDTHSEKTIKKQQKISKLFNYLQNTYLV